MNVAPAALLALGDLQYGGRLEDSYGPTWGRFRRITHPVIGNHDRADDYFEYFGAAAGAPGRGYYSFDLGSWHVVALTSECDELADGCGAGSRQERWLRADLAAHPRQCTLAYWHHPRYSRGPEGDNIFMRDIWQSLYTAGADVVLSGHSHSYERFLPQDNDGNADPKGITEFVVGTGGVSFTGLGDGGRNSAARTNDTFGILKLVLHRASYEWQFIPEDARAFTDSGSAACH